jgi:hypothetical protein
MSDSQWCLHWYLHITDASQGVLVSPDAYGFDQDDDGADPAAPWLKHEIDLVTEDIYLCAPSFPEFVYRYWLENELWFSLTRGTAPLPDIQARYAEHYLKGSRRERSVRPDCTSESIDDQGR